MGKGKSSLEWDYLMAVQVTMYTSYLSYQELSTSMDLKENGAGRLQLYNLPSPNQDQESITIKKDMFSKLSPHAKMVIEMVLDPTAYELKEITTPKTGKTSRHMLHCLLKKKGWKETRIRTTFNELRLAVANLE